MRALFLFFCFFVSCSLAFSQSGARGAISEGTAPDESFLFGSSKVKAVIVGVSEYKSENIFDLQYADDDATSFCNWLIENTNADTSDVVLLLDDQSEPTRVVNTLFEQVKVSGPGTLVIFYYAGHGDVDTSMRNKAFLLMHEVRKNSDYFSDKGAMDIRDILDITSFATDRNVNFLLISDACRSGKIVNTKLGTELTLTQLTKEWDNIHKIVSCEQDQLSMEDEKWGGGHGVFTYYLLEGLKGAAADESGIITFGDLKFYIESNVWQATDKQQLPVLQGSRSRKIIRINK